MPDPGQLARIRHLRIVAPASACPGKAFAATYDGQLDDGSFLPHRLPPELLRLESPDAKTLITGDWTPDPDPIASISSGFPIVATLRADPSVADTIVLPPEYSCLPRGFRFAGPAGDPGGRGGDGPPVTVSLSVVRTPYYQALIVAGIRVSSGLPYYVVTDASKVPPSGWISVVSAGGQGGWGIPGAPGKDGAPGADGCPGTPGDRGDDGGAGGAGGPGGHGGLITIVGPEDWPLFAGFVDARSEGGAGGPGGPGGAGGEGGKGGVHVQAAHAVCSDGAKGPPGRQGTSGHEGPRAPAGSPPQIVPVSALDVFGSGAPAALTALVKSSPHP
jgi:hypothetical protein